MPRKNFEMLDVLPCLNGGSAIIGWIGKMSLAEERSVATVDLVRNLAHDIERLPTTAIHGRITGIVGHLVEVEGMAGILALGDNCSLIGRDGRRVTCEVVGFRSGTALLMPFGSLGGIGPGCRAAMVAAQPAIHPAEGWLGRVIDAFGLPIDGKGPLPSGPLRYPLKASPPPAHQRQRIGRRIDLGVRAINTFTTCCAGQRMGIFAGSGVGKSTLLSMMAERTDADVSIVGLVGERGREAREFIEDSLGEAGMARSVVVVATSDEAPAVRRQAAYTTLTVAEFFRDRGRNVLCLMDSVTRFAMAQREIGLAAGEPPTSKGYPPSVFAELPQLLERAGPGGPGQGTITGLFTVLVEGDDHNEPIADAVRSILDGHLVLDRKIAERGRFPAINVLRSVSRAMPACNTKAESAAIERARRMLALYENMAELIRLGAYRRGSDPEVDLAIRLQPDLEAFLRQSRSEEGSLDAAFAALAGIIAAADQPDSASSTP
jgi:flagellum-specific ATP synthase